jgi:hypothetical protein
MSTALSEVCGSVPTVLFCLSPEARVVPLPALIPAVELAVNTVNEVAGGNVLNPVPLPPTAALGDRIVAIYKGGNVSVTSGATTIYSFDPVADLNKAVAFRFDGLAWVLA